jgi:cobalt-zinc-cadmium efflux system membrane fusion protein
MTSNTSKKQAWLIALVIAVGVALGAVILLQDKAQPARDEHGHSEAAGHGDEEHHGKEEAGHADDGKHADKEHHDRAPAKGPHGGKLFTEGPYGIEVTIFEQNVEPQFRLYPSLAGKPLDPAQTQVELTLERLGQAPQVIRFKKEGDYLLGNAVVEEPHSFKVKVRAIHAGNTHAFGYDQVEARVAMSDAQLQGAGVELATAGPAKIRTTLNLLGEVKYNSDRTVHVVPQLSGLVQTVLANAGDRVRKGQVLATLSSQALADQRGDLLAAQRRLALARITYEREKTLWEQKISPEQDVQQARATMQEADISVQAARQKLATLGAPSGSNLTHYKLRSPIDGVVTDKRITAGEMLKEDAVVFTVSDLSSVWVEAPVSAQDLGTIAKGQKAVVTATAFDAQAEGRVAHVSALVGEQTRTAVARIVVANPKGLWRPGLPVTVEVIADEKEVPVAIAVEAIQDLRDRKVVFGRYSNELEARPLQLGRSDGRHIEVLGGVKAGEKYAAKNSFVIKAELGKAGASHEH